MGKTKICVGEYFELSKYRGIINFGGLPTEDTIFYPVAMGKGNTARAYPKFIFGDDSEWKIYGEIEGLGSLNTSVDTTLNTNGIGNFVSYTSLPQRVVSFNVVYTGKDREQKRQELLNKILYEQRYNLLVVYNGVCRELENCVLSSLKINTGNIHGFLNVSLSFTAFNPILWDNNDVDDKFVVPLMKQKATQVTQPDGNYTADLKFDCTAPVNPLLRLSSPKSTVMSLQATGYNDIEFKIKKIPDGDPYLQLNLLTEGAVVDNDSAPTIGLYHMSPEYFTCSTDIYSIVFKPDHWWTFDIELMAIYRKGYLMI